MKLDRRTLEGNLVKVIESIKSDKEKVNSIKQELAEFSIRPGIIQKIFANPEIEVPLIEDLRFLALLTDQIYTKTGNLSVRTSEYFTEVEQKSAKLYSADMYEEELLSFPLTLENVLMIDDENYLTTLDVKFIKRLMDSKLLRYNFDTQRDAKYARKKNSIERVANVYMPHVKQITSRLLEGNLSPTTLTFNALVGSSDSGDELTYFPKKMELQINEGTFLDILDGFHRINGFMNALDQYPDLEFTFQVAIKNYTLSKAQEHIAEINTYYAMSSTHKTYLEQTRYGDTIVKELNRSSDLKGRISTSWHTHALGNELVTSKTLSDTIEEQFKPESKKDAMEIAAYLTDFFDYLIGSYQTEFVTDVEDTKEESLISSNVMFAGYIVLAKKMREKNVKITSLPSILNTINFKRDNPDWIRQGILDENKNITNNARKLIKDYFKKLDMEMGVK